MSMFGRHCQDSRSLFATDFHARYLPPVKVRINHEPVTPSTRWFNWSKLQTQPGDNTHCCEGKSLEFEILRLASTLPWFDSQAQDKVG